MSALSFPWPPHPCPAPSQATDPLDLPSLIGAAGWSRLPTAVQRRFGTGHADACYVGRMELRCSRIGRVFAALAGLFGGPLMQTNESAVATIVRVHGNDQGGMVWDRHFQRPGHAGHIVRSTKAIGADGDLVERTDGSLSMSLDAFEEDGSLVFLSRRFRIALGRIHLTVPPLLTPGVCRVTHTDLGHGLFRFTLTMVHPLWGETFRQTGVFSDPHPESNT